MYLPKNKLTPSQLAVFTKINASIPKQWLDQLVYKGWAYPDIRKVVDLGLKDPEVVGETRKKLEEIKASPIYSATKEFINFDIELKIDKHISRKVNEAIRKGALPKLTKDDFVVKPDKNVQSALQSKDTPVA